MKLTLFPSDKGDCLLLESSDGKRMLCDGGMQSSFTASVADQLSPLGTLDIVYISHIDDDHIGGVLKLLNDAMDWKVFDHHQSQGDNVRQPKVPRPPQIQRLWHNAFHDVIKDNAGRIEDVLAAMAPMLSSTGDADLEKLARDQQSLITSKAQAIEVSDLVSPEELGIPVNEAQHAGDEHKLMMMRDNQDPFALGTLDLTLIAPFEPDLRKFRKEWDDWLRENKKKVKELRQDAKKQADRLGNDVDRLLAPFVFEASEFGDRTKVTLPNLVSLMFFVKEKDGKTLLLTGDGHSKDILKGLRQTGKMSQNDDIHVDILKVQHHGSQHNIDGDFCRRVSADHYVFCGNGFSGNPEPTVLELIYNSRFGADPSKRATHPRAKNRAVRFWFNTCSARETQKARRDHMKALEQMCDRWVQAQPKFGAKFMDSASLEVK